ncbi:hypothetical protein ILUMI_07555 [Ignelater luminosus]|uniref:AAA-ATPase-like domain-containing protein n=1 Tax=Ignelater luminosus TaxID=2038154 RepID=A0A8K0D679_IGNLU|nr:hypothetical protein ILUMI_07555 [Ignelater luminosus]
MSTPLNQAESDLSDSTQSSSEESEHKASNTPLNKRDWKLDSANFIELLELNGKTPFIDKTLLIKEFLKSGKKRVLVTAPRCFGKTINISMLQHFLEIQTKEKPTDKNERFQKRLQRTQNYKLFSENNLKIMQETKIVRKHFGRYPVISVSFKCESYVSSYQRAFELCKKVIVEAFNQHAYLRYSPKLLPEDKQHCKRWRKNYLEGFVPRDVFNGLNTLASYLYKHFEKKVFLLIDDYDGIINQAMLRPEIRDRLKDIIQDCTSIIKNAAYEHYVQGVFITGISHMGLSGTSINRYKFLGRHQFVDFYGLTGEEVEELLTDTCGLTEEQVGTARRKYGGYFSVSGRQIYNLLSLLEYASDPDARNQYYSWKNTGVIIGLENAFKIADIREMIERRLLLNRVIPVTTGTMTVDETVDLATLIKGQVLQKPEYYKSSIFFLFLLDQGYLAHADEKCFKDGNYWLMLPNEEIRQVVVERIIAYNIGNCGLKKTSYLREYFAEICETRFEPREFIEFTDCLSKCFNLPKFITESSTDAAFNRNDGYVDSGASMYLTARKDWLEDVHESGHYGS